MLQKWNAYLFPAKDAGGGNGGGRVRWGRISASVCLLVVLSFGFICYTAFNSGEYNWWRCPGCVINPNKVRLAPTTTGNAAAPLSAAGSRDAAPTNLSHIVFCIGGSVSTWSRRQGYSDLWWRQGQTRGHVWLDEEPRGGPSAWSAAGPPYRVSTDASQFGARSSASRMARIVAESQRLHAEDRSVRWFVMGDDDTVFFVDNLVATLGKYDHEEMYYVGAPSESVEQNEMHSYAMAFGGGGFAVSAPAAAELARVIDGCLDRYAYFYGSDQRVQSCLSELGVPLTREPGFHQLDLRGDAYGILAAHPVAPLVSLHHLDYLEPIIPHRGGQLDALRTLVNASLFDPGRILQQSFCYEAQRAFTWSVSVSWGYTVQLYPTILAAKDMEVPFRTFKTWRSSSDGPFTFNTRPFPAGRPCEVPLLYFLSRVREENVRDGTNITVSEYTLHSENIRGHCKDLPGYGAALTVETIKVFAPKMDPDAWKRVRLFSSTFGQHHDVILLTCFGNNVFFDRRIGGTAAKRGGLGGGRHWKCE
ncbi:hypothetical protein Cni_G09417 [Canna indica]|uniref:Uncharacterized protein n=1 Tax=Canna indica TaxID=4628 RepID=A0AAQ3Q7Q1_9LILI|nr:hypothetical protein Cni_G09417 [Canna indica]